VTSNNQSTDQPTDQSEDQKSKLKIEPTQIANELQTGASNYAGMILNNVPLVESVAIIFGYSIENQELPTAVVMGQSGNLTTPSEFVHMLIQLSKTTHAVTQQSFGVIRGLDQLMGEKANELQTIQNQTTELNEQIAVKQQELVALEAKINVAKKQTGDAS